MIPLKVPPLGESIVEATISKWRKQQGEAVATGETVVELDTDKITVEVPALKAGVLSSRAKNEGDIVKVGDVLGEIDETASAAAQPAAPAKASAAAPSAQSAPKAEARTPTAAPARAPERAAAPAAPSPSEVRASPAARRAATESGIDLGAVPGTGRGGVVSKPDVVAARGAADVATKGPPAATEETAKRAPTERGQGPAVATSAAPRPPAGRAPVTAAAGDGQRETREKMSVRRRRIAEHLLEAQHATAHLTTFNEIDMSAVIALRDRLKERVEEEHGAKLTFMPFFVKSVCVALKSFPMLNAQIAGDEVIYKHYVHMGIAVASDEGLVVPVIKDADRKGMIQISRDIVDIAKRAREKKLTMDDLTGGTFTITNGGVFGSLISTPILNYPQVGILGLHKIQERPVVIDGRIEVRPMMYVALTYDHRIVDGQQSVLFVVRLKELLEDPAAMLVE
jgi:2-oxoglutarate dehydrogenase E2 component (dihydrolipoamide succinyltransferase)